MKRILLLFAFWGMVLGFVVFAEDKPPVIDDHARAQFWKAQAGAVQAQESVKEATQKAQAAQVELQAAVEQLKKECGDKFQPQMGNSGDVECVVKPEPPKPPVKK